MITSIQYLLATLMGFFGKDSIKSQKGVTMVEYGLVAALMATIVVAVLGATGEDSFQGALESAFTEIAGAISDNLPE